MEIKLPDIGEGIAEGEIVQWYVKKGDTIEPEQALLEILTDKASVEIPAPQGGIVDELLFNEGDLVPVGQPLVRLLEEKTTSFQQESAIQPTSRSQVLATPSIRRLAREQNIDLTQITGSGPYGRIQSADLLPLSYKTRPESFSSVEERLPLRGIRRKIAEQMVRSKFTIPEFMYADEVDMTELVMFREETKVLLDGQNIRLTYLPFIVQAVISGLKQYPYLNAMLDEVTQEIVFKKEYHIGIATATDKGLLVPVIQHADRLSVLELAQEIERLAVATRDGKAGIHELQGSTFTITNIGAIGGIMSVPIINYPEVAIMGINKIAQKPVVYQGEIVARWMSTFSLCFDHRVVDGIDGARFTEHIKKRLENPKLLLLEK